jgi:hypothetical protein
VSPVTRSQISPWLVHEASEVQPTQTPYVPSVIVVSQVVLPEKVGAVVHVVDVVQYFESMQV